MSIHNKSIKKERPRIYYSESFKRSVVTEFETGLYTKAQLLKKYEIKGHASLDRWLKKYGNLYHHSYSSKGRPMKNQKDQYIKELEAQLVKQKKEHDLALEVKRKELDAYKRMIEIAERDLQIKIKKKFGSM